MSWAVKPVGVLALKSGVPGKGLSLHAKIAGQKSMGHLDGQPARASTVPLLACKVKDADMTFVWRKKTTLGSVPLRNADLVLHKVFFCKDKVQPVKVWFDSCLQASCLMYIQDNIARIRWRVYEHIYGFCGRNRCVVICGYHSNQTNRGSSNIRVWRSSRILSPGLHTQSLPHSISQWWLKYAWTRLER